MNIIETLLTQIAQSHLGIQTLETRNSDSLDFHDVAVWSLHDALRAAYEAGAKGRATKESRKRLALIATSAFITSHHQPPRRRSP